MCLDSGMAWSGVLGNYSVSLYCEDQLPEKEFKKSNCNKKSSCSKKHMNFFIFKYSSDNAKHPQSRVFCDKAILKLVC